MQQFHGTSLKTRLYPLILVAFVPVALLIFYVADQEKSLEIESLLHKTGLLAQAVANEENMQLDATRTLLTTVGDAYRLMAGRSDKLSDLLVNLQRQSRIYAAFGLVGSEGRLRAGSAPFDDGQEFSRRAWFSACLQNKALTIGPYAGEHIGGEPVLYVAQPVFDRQGTIAAVTFAALSLNWMNRTMFKRLDELPPGSRLSLLDEGQGMLRFDLSTQHWSVPQKLSPDVQQKVASRQAGTLRAVDEAGVARIYTFAPLASSFRDRHIVVLLEIPEALALAASRKVFNRNLVLLLITALIAVASIWWAGEKLILKRIRAMVDATRALAAGNLETRIGDIAARDELSHLAGVFDEMAASLQSRIEQETRFTASLERSREQLRSLAAYQNDVREQEQRRIAREIHDQLGQSLTILRMDLAWLKKHLSPETPQTETKIEGMSRVIAEALETLHTVTAELRPVILDDFGLAAAITWQIDEFHKRSGIAARMEPTDFEPALPKDLATALFRIFQETLTNIIRHAQADQVAVRLTPENGDLVLQIRDNGRGITPAEIENPRSFGLIGIRERLYPWNGSVLFEGQPGKGTQVTIRLPMPSKGMPQ